MRTIAIQMVVGRMIAGSIFFAGNASAYCDAAECVPNVARNIIAGGPCAPRVRNVALECPGLNLSAQGSDGVPFQCVDMGGGELKWAHRPDTPG